MKNIVEDNIKTAAKTSGVVATQLTISLFMGWIRKKRAVRKARKKFLVSFFVRIKSK